MMKWLDFFTIKQKLTILLSLLLIAISYISITQVLDSKQHNLHNTNIEIVQQQQIIVERYINAFFIANQQATISQGVIDNSAIKKYQFLFEQNLKALLYGGKIYTDLGMKNSIYIDAITSSTIKENIIAAEKLWKQLHSTSQSLALQAITQEQLDIYHHISEKLRTKQEVIIDLLTKQRTDNTQSDLLLLQISWLLLLIIGPLLTWKIARNITQPLDNIAKATSRMRLGDLQSYPAQNTHHDELGTLLYQADEMRLIFSDLMKSIQQHNKQISHSSEQMQQLSSDANNLQHRQRQQHGDISEQLANLQLHTEQQLKVLNNQSDSYIRNHALIQEYWKTVLVTIEVTDDIQNNSKHSVESITLLKDNLTQASHNIAHIDQAAIKTEELARKATVNAARKEQGSENINFVTKQLSLLTTKTVTDIADLSLLLTQSQTQTNTLSIPVNNINKQSEHSLQRLLKSDQFIDAITLEIQKQQLQTQELELSNKRQLLQLSSMNQSLQDFLLSLKESEEKVNSSHLFAQDLHKISQRLEALLHNVKLDSKENRRRKGNDKRLYPRIQNQLTVTLHQADKILLGLTQDLSLSGLQLKSMQSVQFNHHTAVTFIIEIPMIKSKGEQQTIELLGDVVHYEEIDNAFYYGVRFHSLSNQQKKKLQQTFDYFEKMSEFKK